jgi:hypothetical protein
LCLLAIACPLRFRARNVFLGALGRYLLVIGDITELVFEIEIGSEVRFVARAAPRG